MKDGPDIARIGSLIGDPARANMLVALMVGKALTATELANEAGVTPQTASFHLGKLEEGGLVSPRKQGRHKYFSLTDHSVARALEALMGVAAEAGHLRTRTGPRNAELRQARVCYDHLAGSMATRLFADLIASGRIQKDPDGLALTPQGELFAESLGIEILKLREGRMPLCRECLDWSERRSHLGGRLGRALLARFESRGWARRSPGSRVIIFTHDGLIAFESLMAP